MCLSILCVEMCLLESGEPMNIHPAIAVSPGADQFGH